MLGIHKLTIVNVGPNPKHKLLYRVSMGTEQCGNGVGEGPEQNPHVLGHLSKATLLTSSF